MNSIQDALYNWLTIKVVCEARPDDSAAQETMRHFDDLLAGECQISQIDVEKDDKMYYVTYQKGEENNKARFPRELIEVMLNQINEAPDRYANYPAE